MLSALLIPALVSLGAPSSQPSDTQPVTGTIKLGKGLKAVKGSVFIILRPEGAADRGPPMAVLRINQPKFPVSFEIGPQNVMIPGTQFKGPFNLYARLDQDGNPLTKEAGDLYNSSPVQVNSGDKRVPVILNKTR